jgi:hypothetical protein
VATGKGAILSPEDHGTLFYYVLEESQAKMQEKPSCWTGFKENKM